MARPTRHAKGAPCWIDLSTSNQEQARDFYTALLGWTADDPDPQFGGYFTFRKDGIAVAGCMGRTPDQPGPDAWSVHLSTPDARQTLADATAHGGQVIVDAMDVGDLGTMSVIADPSGAVVGAWQPGTHPGFGVVYENDAPVWFELHTRDYEKALDFYRAVFGWQTVTAMDSEELRYTLVQQGETQLAGVMDDTSNEHATGGSHWLVYFGVADADAAAARIKELGGRVTLEPMDTPYGRLASAVDPTGATFNLMQPTPAMPMDTASPKAAANPAQ
jgi:predicted enzyme related to lactoylglutathione lyase